MFSECYIIIGFNSSKYHLVIYEYEFNSFNYTSLKKHFQPSAGNLKEIELCLGPGLNKRNEINIM